jgi:hypothetical protein
LVNIRDLLVRQHIHQPALRLLVQVVAARQLDLRIPQRPPDQV